MIELATRSIASFERGVWKMTLFFSSFLSVMNLNRNTSAIDKRKVYAVRIVQKFQKTTSWPQAGLRQAGLDRSPFLYKLQVFKD